MTAEQLIYATLSPLMPDARLYPEHLPEKPQFPAAMYRRVSGLSEGTVCAEGDTARIHIHIYADTPAECRERVAAFQAALRRIADGSAEQDGAPDYGYHYELRMYYGVLDYLVQSN